MAAATAAAALSHVAIDVVGDYALPHDTYDNVAHGSRELLAAIALAAAAMLAVRGIRRCCEIGAAHRGSLPARLPSWPSALRFTLATVGLAALIVPAMEVLDARLAGVPVGGIDDAFGGSVFLGLGITMACATLVAVLVFGVARWLVSHRDAIAAIIVTLMARDSGAQRSEKRLRRLSTKPRPQRTARALRRCKRGPPHGARFRQHHVAIRTEGVFRVSPSVSHAASRARDRADISLRRAGLRGFIRTARWYFGSR